MNADVARLASILGPADDLTRDADGHPDVEDMLSLVHRLTGAATTEFRIKVAGPYTWRIGERGGDPTRRWSTTAPPCARQPWRCC